MLGQLFTHLEIQINTYIDQFTFHMTLLGEQSGTSKANDHCTDHVVYCVGSEGFLGQQDAHGEKNVDHIEHVLRSLIVCQSPFEHADAE